MYREKIDKFIDAHKTEMLEDIAELCKIDSTKDSYRAGRPYGDGCFEALGAALHIAECYGFSINNYFIHQPGNPRRHCYPCQGAANFHPVF